MPYHWGVSQSISDHERRQRERIRCGYLRYPAPSFMAVSTSSADASPRSTSFMASNMYGTRLRFHDVIHSGLLVSQTCSWIRVQAAKELTDG